MTKKLEAAVVVVGEKKVGLMTGAQDRSAEVEHRWWSK